MVVERHRGTSVEDTHGNTIIDWTNPDVLTIARCWIGPAGLGTEEVNNRQTTVLQLQWWGPFEADVKETDRLKSVRTGLVYEVAGPVVPIESPTGNLDQKTCR